MSIEPPVSLSIAIPTYNFGAFIGETLASIASQLVPGVEIVILDGGSTDQTAEVVAGWQARHPEIVYHRQPHRGGIDRDMARVVELSRGRYVWLFSADDIMLEGALARVLGEIEGGFDVVLCAHDNRDLELRLIDVHRALALDEDATFDFAFARDRQRYFQLSRTTEAFFSFISSLVVRREAWRSIPLDERFVGSAWAHVPRLLTLLKGGMRLAYIAQPLSARRGGNDSFSDGGKVKRCALAVEGFDRIADLMFGRQTFEARMIRRAVAREFTLRHFLYMKSITRHDPNEDWSHLRRLVALTFWDRTFGNRARRALVDLMPSRVLPILQKMRHPGRILRLASR